MFNTFKSAVQTALHNANLTGALGKFSEAYKVNRAKAYEAIDFEALRSVIADRKAYAAAHLDELADRFIQKATALGAHVFRANSPEQAKSYILKVAQERGVKTVVKAMSMASSRTHRPAVAHRRATAAPTR